MKKYLITLLTLVLCFTLVGCGEKEKNNENNNNGNSNNQNENNGSNKKYEYTYTDGVLTQIVDEEGNPKQTDFVIDGIILSGNRHFYNEVDADGNIEFLAKQGYKKEGLNKDFYLNEWIEFYIDTKYSKPVDDVKIIVTPHKTVEELEKLSLSKLEELANENGGFVLDYKTPEEDNYKYVGNGYVNMDYPEGKYDILFTYKGKLAYFININETKEPTE